MKLSLFIFIFEFAYLVIWKSVIVGGSLIGLILIITKAEFFEYSSPSYPCHLKVI